MANWVGKITDAGADLIAQWVSGSTLNISASKAGTGCVDEDEMAEQTALYEEKQSLSIIGGKQVERGKQVTVQLVAPSVGYTLNQIGIYAKLNNGNPVLLALYQNEQGIPIPSITEAPDFIYAFSAVIAMSNTGTFSITIDTTSVVNQETMETFVEEFTDGKLLPEPSVEGQIVQSQNVNGQLVWVVTDNAIPYTTVAPTQNNPNGLKVVYLQSEPQTKYNGYIYLIKE